MAKTSVVERNKKRQRMETKYRAKKAALKEARKDAYKKGEIPWEVQMELQSLPRNSHQTRLCKRCRLCGRPRGVYQKFGMCRACLRKFAMMGYFPGLEKASW